MKVGRYEVTGELGRGGMGAVYRANDPATGREVALKVVLNEPGPRFEQEARACAALQHPGIVTLYDVARTEDGRPFLVLELVDGESLDDRIERLGRLDADDAVELALQLCEAIGYAHGRGVIHRDLKPANVLVTPEGRVKVTDFGLGKVVDQEQHLTRTGAVMGTPAYMPPEQAEGDRERMGPRSDVYSLGATLYAMLTGQPPFVRESQINLITAVLMAEPEPPSTHAPGLRASLDEVCLTCLAKDPGDRYGSAEELAAALEDALLRDAMAGGAPTWLPAAALAGVALILVAILVAALGKDPPPDRVVAATPPAPSSPLPAPTTDAPTPQAKRSSPAPRREWLHFETASKGFSPLRATPEPLWEIRQRDDDPTQHALFLRGERAGNSGITGVVRLDRVVTELTCQVRIDSWFGDVYLYPVHERPDRWVQVRLLPRGKDGGWEGIYVRDTKEPARPDSDERRASLSLKTWHDVALRIDKQARRLFVEVDGKPWIRGTVLPAGFQGVTALGFHGRGWIDELRYR